MKHKYFISRRNLGLGALLFLSLLICIVAFSAINGRLQLRVVLHNLLLNIPLCLLAGYIDYLIIRFMQRGSHAYSLLMGCFSLFVADSLVVVISMAIDLLLSLFGIRAWESVEQMIPTILWNSLFVLFIELSLYNRQLMENKMLLMEMEKEKAVYQFEALKSQLNPHFLFNSLNVLSALAYKDADKTNKFAKKLSSVYRYLLTTHDMDKVPLEDELDFARNYIFLEQLRFGDNLHILIENGENLPRRQIIPVSIQILVENALKHNVNTPEHPLKIRIVIDEDKIQVSNNLQLRQSVSRNRMGLANLAKQYQLHGKQIIVEKDSGTFSVTLPLL
mgnify:FL=1